MNPFPTQKNMKHCLAIYAASARFERKKKFFTFLVTIKYNNNHEIDSRMDMDEHFSGRSSSIVGSFIVFIVFGGSYSFVSLALRFYLASTVCRSQFDSGENFSIFNFNMHAARVPNRFSNSIIGGYLTNVTVDLKRQK